MAKLKLTVSGNRDFTDEEIIQIFTARAGGATLPDLVDRFGKSSSHIAAILHERLIRHRRAYELVPSKIRATVIRKNDSFHNISKSRKGKRKNGTKVSPADLNGQAEASLGSYAAACRDFEHKREQCLALGFPADGLDLINDLIVARLHRSK
jgi:hypothetical protein